MLAEERFSKISKLVNSKGSATVQELIDEIGISESTIRRDLIEMDKRGYITKVHGGAIIREKNINTQDEKVINRQKQNYEEKLKIAKYAASLIVDNDFIYIDAGTTTELMIDYISAKNVCFVTNSIKNAKELSDKGYKVFILGGEFKSATEAIVGDDAVITLDKYYFTKGFIGANGISDMKGITTPEIKEAMVKKKSLENCKEKYILADVSKFEKISSIKFAEFDEARIITNKLIEERYGRYTKYNNVFEI